MIQPTTVMQLEVFRNGLDIEAALRTIPEARTTSHQPPTVAGTVRGQTLYFQLSNGNWVSALSYTADCYALGLCTTQADDLLALRALQRELGLKYYLD